MIQKMKVLEKRKQRIGHQRNMSPDVLGENILEQCTRRKSINKSYWGLNAQFVR
jgi:hypothetical protein